jgi:hypothetical protein
MPIVVDNVISFNFQFMSMGLGYDELHYGLRPKILSDWKHPRSLGPLPISCIAYTRLSDSYEFDLRASFPQSKKPKSVSMALSACLLNS